MKKILLLASLFLFTPCLARANDTIYSQSNNPANYVKLEGLKSKTGDATQPFTFTQDQMEDIMRSVRYSRRSMFSDTEKIRSVFEWETIQKYAPKLVEAFSKAKPDQAVIFSIAQKRPLVILRNDRLTQVKMWVTGNNELHMYFIKTEAKLEGDYQAKTTGRSLIENAKGLRIMLEPQTGQKFALDTTDEIILNLSTNWGQVADAIDAEDARLEEEAKAKKRKNQAKADTSTSSTTSPATSAAPPMSAKDQKNAEERLDELKRLKDKGLINEQDYNKKKEEIIQGI